VEKKVITLYYSNSNADKVVAEKREVEISKDTQIERLVFEELQRVRKARISCHNTKRDQTFISIHRKRHCTLNLSKEFVDNHPGGTAGEQ